MTPRQSDKSEAFRGALRGLSQRVEGTVMQRPRARFLEMARRREY